MSFTSTSPISRFWHTVTTPPATKQHQQKHQPRSHSSTTKLLNKMFVRSGNNLPADPRYPDSLEELGYMIDAKGQVVSIAPPHSFSPSYISDSERANEVHREALHAGVRRAVKKDLAKLGVRPIYCGGPDGTRLSDEPVKGSPSLPIFTTDLSEMQNKRDIIVVIGEHNQDPIVWAWRSAMREGGLQEATAVGLVRKLMTLGFGGLPSRDEAEAAGVAKAGVTTSNRIDSVGAADESSATPGLILLNPGQRLYSPQLNEAMTQVSWLARPKPNALAQAHKIDNDHNKIPGHYTPYEHVGTFFDGILDQLIVHESSLRLWIVGISDGAEAFINYMDAQLHRDHTARIGSMVSGMAFMEPAHDPTMLKSQTTKTFLHSTGKCWIKSSKPMGTWVNAPGAMKKINHPSQEDRYR
ncbi:hypothetical protein BDY17DRAFT_178759 [Neohortaea acidophila]|uniref:Arb2 domain-containing protein n=1 Tax=Neohortaea acidophila TaxID=245834 RepID=A0A6A6PRR7_9PEZI|nr:uncharacterized protein BDY17DRAFT_178759 [Neohortaea acidophila]KAF2482163.1 hypothetical protein BDY17DRAFT_178759 [Neohortaea acidophila]